MAGTGELRESSVLQRLFEITQDILQARDLQTALVSIAQGIGDVFEFKYVSIVASESGEDDMQRRVLLGFDEAVTRARLGETIPRAALRQLLLPQYEVVPHCFYVPAEREYPWAFSIYLGERAHEVHRTSRNAWHENDALTLVLTDRDGEVLGYVSVDGPADGRVPSRERLREMQLFVNLVGLALSNAQAHAAEVERRRMLEQTAIFQNEFFGMVAHEVRSPLAAIRGATSLLEMHFASLSEERRTDLLGVLNSSTARLGRIFEDFLLLSRMEAGHLSLRLGPIDPVGVVTECVARTKSEHPDRGYEIRHEEPVPTVHADEGRVVQVLGNLLSNAAKYSPVGSTIVAELRVYEDDVWFSIQNEGAGISAEERQKLFTRFGRLSGSGDASTGLGLYISAELVQMMGGAIGCDSEPNRLTTFWFTLPRERDGDDR